jgi:hypothetical protein
VTCDTEAGQLLPKEGGAGAFEGSLREERSSDTGGMITPEDAQFHPSGTERMWTETNYFGFDVPVVPMHVGLYALFRPNLGTVNSAIFANSRQVDASWEADFWDSRAYLPMPASKSLLDYRLDNGLAVRCLEPNKVWELRYDNGESLQIDVRFEALMEPFDIHDPEMDPRARATGRGDLSAGAAYAGHFDMTGAVTGHIVVHGARHAVDALCTMDHSWGVREERQLGVMTWLQCHFSRDFALHAMFDFDPTIGPDQPFDCHLTHGYVLDRGKAIGLKDGSARMNRRGMHSETLELNLVDAQEREYVVRGRAQTRFPVQFWPGSMAFMVMPRWEIGDQVGYGTSTDFLDLHHFTNLYR